MNDSTIVCIAYGHCNYEEITCKDREEAEGIQNDLLNRVKTFNNDFITINNHNIRASSIYDIYIDRKTQPCWSDSCTIYPGWWYDSGQTSLDDFVDESIKKED